MSQASDDRALRDLIECVVNGKASAEQHAELESQLRASEAARDIYLDYVNLHAALRQRFLAPEESGEIDIADFHLALARESFPNPRRHHRGISQRQQDFVDLCPHPRPRPGGQDDDRGRHQAAPTISRAVAIAAIPSPRPVSPRPSVVVAEIDT